MKIRIQKYLSSQGIMSRRQVEKMIKLGKIKLNNKVINEMGIKIDPENDVIQINNKKINLKTNKVFKYYILNKPAGVVCTNKKFKNEKNVFDFIKTKEKLVIVGRLDKESTGLVLLTNDGDLANKITHPKNGCRKYYEVTVNRVINPEVLKNFIKGIKIKNIIYKISKFEVLTKFKALIILKEGKKRHIRQLFTHANYHISKLHRTQIKNVKLKRLRVGTFRELTKLEIEDLKSED